MSQKSGFSSGLDETTLEATVQRLQGQGYREVHNVDDVSHLQPMQFLRRREYTAAMQDRDAPPYWQVLWRAE